MVCDDICLSQSKYASDIIIKRVGSRGASRSLHTPLSSSGKLTIVEGEPLVIEDATEYRHCWTLTVFNTNMSRYLVLS